LQNFIIDIYILQYCTSVKESIARYRASRVIGISPHANPFVESGLLRGKRDKIKLHRCKESRYVIQLRLACF